MKSELDKYDLILKKAREIIIIEGYSKLSISKLTKKCKISKGSFYTYFKSKDSILEKIIDDFEKITVRDFEKFTQNSHNFIDFIENLINSRLNYNEEDLEIILAIANLQKNLEVINDINHYKIMGIHKIFLKYVKANLDNHLTSTKIHKDEIENYSDIIVNLVKYFNFSFLIDKNKKKITLKSIKNIKNTIKSDENINNAKFIIKIISKIIN